MTSCLMLLDLQHGILRSGRIPFESPAIPEDAIAAAERVLACARECGVPVVHVGVARPVRPGVLDVARTQAAANSGKLPRDILPMLPGSEDVAFVLEPVEGEEIVHKIGVSAFASTRADLLLRGLGVRDVFIGGAFTHMVVESTARHGFDLGYTMHVLADLCCSPGRAIHDASLSMGIPNFARVVRGLDDAMAALRASKDR